MIRDLGGTYRDTPETYRDILGPLQRGEQEAQVAVAEALADAHELAQRQNGGLPNKSVPVLSPLVSHNSHLNTSKTVNKQTKMKTKKIIKRRTTYWYT